jgi:hypothetical protein
MLTQHLLLARLAQKGEIMIERGIKVTIQQSLDGYINIPLK